MQHPSSLVGPEVKTHVLNICCSRDGTAPRAERRRSKGRAARSYCTVYCLLIGLPFLTRCNGIIWNWLFIFILKTFFLGTSDSLF